MLPATQPPNKEAYLNRCEALARTVTKPELFPPFLIASYCHQVLVRIYGSPYRLIWLLIKDRTRHDYERTQFRCWESWHKYVMLRTHDEFMEIYEAWIEKLTGYDCREWPDTIEVEENNQQVSTIELSAKGEMKNDAN
jgi:hypothetical protein